MAAIMYSTNLEKSIINSIIQGGVDSMQDAILVLKRSNQHFYNHINKVAYDSLCDMFDKGMTINKLTFYDSMRKTKVDPTAIGKYISDISRMELSPVKESCGILLEYSLRRELDNALNKIAIEVKEDSASSMDILSNMQKLIEDAMESHLVDEFVDLSAIVESASDRIIDAVKSRQSGKMPGVVGGFHELDGMTGGFKPGELVVIAARPGMGKTSFMLSYALQAAKNGEPVALFSLEMDRESLAIRLASQMAMISLSDMLNGALNNDQLKSIGSTMCELTQLPIHIDDSFNLNITTLRARVMKLVRTHGIKAVFIDYLQLMKTPKSSNREREIAETTRALKSIAKEFKLPIVILSQLNRMSEGRLDNRPMMSDLRESGAIEQDADIILLLHRPEAYGTMQYSNGVPTLNTCEVIVAKQRNGAVGEVVLRYIKNLTKFSNLNERSGRNIGDDEDIPF